MLAVAPSSNDRISIGETILHCPGEQPGNRGPDAISGDIAGTLADGHEHVRNIPARDLSQLQTMQGRAVFHDMALDFKVRAGAPVLGLALQKPSPDRFKRLARHAAALDLGPGRVLAKPDPGVDVPGGVARAADINRGHGAKRNAALLTSQLVLDDVATTAAGTQAKAEASNVIIPYDVVRFAGR